VFVCILPGKAVPEVTYTVSCGTLNPTHSLTYLQMLQITKSWSSLVFVKFADVMHVWIFNCKQYAGVEAVRLTEW